MGDDVRRDRRTFVQGAGVGLAALAFGQGLLGGSKSAHAQKVHGVEDPGWHGICYLDGVKEEYLVDPKLKNGNGVPIYILASEGFDDLTAGLENPSACFDDGTCYLPHRLQNNVFGGGGVLWRMFKVEGVGLYADVGGTALYSTGNPDHIAFRDLFWEPFRTADELLSYTDINNPNGLNVIDLGAAFNCPLIPSDGHPVLDLNPFDFV